MWPRFAGQTRAFRLPHGVLLCCRPWSSTKYPWLDSRLILGRACKRYRLYSLNTKPILYWMLLTFFTINTIISLFYFHFRWNIGVNSRTCYKNLCCVCNVWCPLWRFYRWRWVCGVQLVALRRLNVKLTAPSLDMFHHPPPLLLLLLLLMMMIMTTSLHRRCSRLLRMNASRRRW